MRTLVKVPAKTGKSILFSVASAKTAKVHHYVQKEIKSIHCDIDLMMSSLLLKDRDSDKSVGADQVVFDIECVVVDNVILC